MAQNICRTYRQLAAFCRKATLGHINTFPISVQIGYYQNHIVIFLATVHVPDISLHFHIYMCHICMSSLLFYITCAGSALLLCCAPTTFHRWSTPELDAR